MKGLASLLPLLAIVAIFWLLLIRPAQRRNGELKRLHDSLEVGDSIMLSSGFFGTLRAVEDDRVRVELAEGVVVEVARAAVHRVIERADDPAEDDSAPDPTEES
ncbi:MAG: preprotein translocase subunit YajC [Nocardioidaceae bacterium]